MTQLPNWDWHNLSPDAHEFQEHLDDLRTFHPIIWAMITGHRASLAIANSLAMPHSIVLYELRRYKNDRDWVVDEQRPEGIVWKLVDDEYKALYAIVRALKKENQRSLASHDEG